MVRLGSLLNQIMADSAGRAPVVGQGATLVYWTDREPCTVTAVSPSGKTVTLREDKATRLDEKGMSEGQSYSFEPDPSGRVVKARLNKRGRWKTPGGTSVLIGHREKYYDYSF